MGTQKNLLNETALLGTQKVMGKKIFTIMYPEKLIHVRFQMPKIRYLVYPFTQLTPKDGPKINFNVQAYIRFTVKSGNFGHQVNSDIRLQIVEL